MRPLFATLEWLEDRLATNRYLCGERLTNPSINPTRIVPAGRSSTR